MPHDEHDAELPRGALTPADLDQLEGAGVFAVARPGDSGADDFDAAMADDLEHFDAELLARDGPDALTTDRALRLAELKRRQAAERESAITGAEQDSNRVGAVLAAFREQHGWSRDQLADWLGIGADDLARLAAETRPAAVNSMTLLYDPEPLNELADRHGAHRERLYEAFDRGDP